MSNYNPNSNKPPKISKQELKTPDKFQQELQKGFQWTATHSKLVGLLFLAFLVVGAGLSAKSYLEEKSEGELQARYYQAEKKLIEKRTGFEQAKAAAAPPVAGRPPAPQTSSAPASGDLQKDFGPEMESLSQLIQEKPKSKAAKMAALQLAELQIEHQKMPEALETLKKVGADSKDLLSGLLLNQLGTVQANLNDCNAALGTWSKILSNARAKSLHAGVKLKQGLCYENLKDFANAEKMYTEAKTENAESATARAADKYLRLLQTAKN